MLNLNLFFFKVTFFYVIYENVVYCKRKITIKTYWWLVRLPLDPKKKTIRCSITASMLKSIKILLCTFYFFIYLVFNKAFLIFQLNIKKYNFKYNRVEIQLFLIKSIKFAIIRRFSFNFIILVYFLINKQVNILRLFIAVWRVKCILGEAG